MGKELKKPIVYTKSNCVQCDSTKRYLTKYGIEYKEIDLEIDLEAMEYVKELGFTASPVVLTEYGNWSGFRISKLEHLISEYKLERVKPVTEPAYKQLIRDEIYKREHEGKAIFEIAEEVERIIREAVATEK